MLDFMFPLWTFVLIGRPQDYFEFLKPYRLFLATTILILIIVVFLGHLFFKKMFEEKESRLYAAFYMILLLGLPFAHDKEVALRFVAVSYMGNMVYYYIFIQYINSMNKFRKILFTILFCFFFYGLFMLKTGYYYKGRLNPDLTMHDSNSIVFVMISLLPIGIFFLRSNVGIIKKTLAITSIIISIIVILLSGSRGGLISFLAMILYSLMVFRKQIKVKYLIVPSLIFATLLVVYSEKINFSRYSMRDIETDYNVTTETGRLAVWEKGYELFLSNPITGIGADCFAIALGDLRRKKSIPPMQQAAHNSFLQIAAETGIFGIMLFLLLLYHSFQNLRRCRRNENPSDDRPDIALVAGLLQVGFVGMLVNSFFLSLGYTIFLTLYFALSVTLKNICFETKERPKYIKA